MNLNINSTIKRPFFSRENGRFETIVHVKTTCSSVTFILIASD